MKVVTTAEMRRIEQRAVDQGIALSDLMLQAGRAVARAVFDTQTSGPVLVLVGPGNNGGDGLIAAQALFDAGRTVTAYCFSRKRLERFAGAVIHAEDDVALNQFADLTRQSSVIVDALLGIGQSRPLEGLLARIVQAVNDWKRRDTVALAVDIPTGVNADSGAADLHAFQADVTIAMGFLKCGHVLHPGTDYCGDSRVVGVGFPPNLAGDILTSVPATTDIASLLPVRHADSNKGTYGRVMFIGGSHNFMGAPVLASLAAYRVGAGLVDIAVPQSVQQAVAVRAVEAVFNPLPERNGQLTPEGIDALKGSMERASAIVFGPGMGHSEATIDATRAFVQLLTELKNKPAVIDADGLNALSQIDRWWHHDAPIVLTPHPGEMSRLTGISVPEIQSDRLNLARRFAAMWGKIVVLKGAGTIVASPSGEVSINPTGGPNLATAGTGDVLSGTIGGLLAQGMRPEDAAIAGTYLHGRTGDKLREAHGDAGTIASDLLAAIPLARKSILEEAGGNR